MLLFNACEGGHLYQHNWRNFCNGAASNIFHDTSVLIVNFLKRSTVFLILERRNVKPNSYNCGFKPFKTFFFFAPLNFILKEHTGWYCCCSYLKCPLEGIIDTKLNFTVQFYSKNGSCENSVLFYYTFKSYFFLGLNCFVC